MRLILLTSLLLIAVLAANAQNAVLHGVVSDDSDGNTIPGVNVVTEDNQGTTTNLDGKFELNLTPGAYTITFSYLGYEDKTRDIILKDGDNIEMNIALATEATAVGLVVVTSDKYSRRVEEVTVSIEVLTPEMISNSASTGIDKALNKVPGVDMLGEQINIRGGTGYAAGSSSRVLMLMDGLPLLKPDNGTIEFGSLPMENIQQIEVIKGAASALYGSSALNGIVNLITANPKSEPFTKITAQYGFYENPFKKKHKDLIWWDRIPFFGGFNFGHRRRFKQVDLVLGGNYFEDGNYLYGTKYRRVNANIKVKYRPKNYPNLTMGINTNLSSQEGGFFFLWKGWGPNPETISDSIDMHITNLIEAIKTGDAVPRNIRDSVPRAATAYIPGEITTFRSLPISFDPYLTYFDKKNNMHAFKGRVYITFYENSNGEKNKSNIAYGEYTFHSELKKYGLNFVTGVSSSYSWIKSETFGQRKNTNASTFLQIDKKFFDKLTINVGFRGEYFKLDSLDVVLKPIFRTGFNLQLTESTFLRGSYGQGYRFPAISEKFVRTTRSGVAVVPNQDVQPESGWSAELAIKQGLKLSKAWIGYFDFAGFITQYSDMIEFVLLDSAPPGETCVLCTQAQNVADKARISGMEVSVFGQGEIFGYPTTILMGYTYIVPINLDAADSLDLKDKMLNFRFQHSAKADLQTTVKKVTFGVTATYVSFMENVGSFAGINDIGKYREANENGEFVLDARVGFNFTDEAKVSLVAKNITGNQYTLRPGYMEAPRNYTVQVSYQF